MEHQDTKQTSMCPRLKELNDIPYLAYTLDYQRFYFGTEIHGFIFNKDTVWLRIDIIHGTS